MGFVVLLDANVLYPETLRDVLLSLAEDGVFQVRWTPDILDEVERNVARRAKTANPTAAPSGAATPAGSWKKPSLRLWSILRPIVRLSLA